MREIRFRAWQQVTKTMFYNIEKGTGAPDGNPPFADYLENTSMTVMQYTGLHDKNGKDIYEGDILHLGPAREKFVPVASSDTTLEVFYTHGAFTTREGNLGDMTDWHECEVIGNRYEPSELLVH